MTKQSGPLQCFARQALRTALVAEWLDALNLRAGDCVADLGCGAGYVAVRAAQWVGSEGIVHALDADPDAVAFLGELADLHGLSRIRCRVRRLDELEPLSPRPVAALMSMVLHHLEDPAATLRRIAEVLEGPSILIAEFDAGGPCRVGPPRDMRVSCTRVESIVREAGMAPRMFRQQTSEHWFMVAVP